MPSTVVGGHYFAVRRKIDPTLFVSSNGWAPFKTSTLYTFTDDSAYTEFVKELPPTVELVEITFRVVTDRPVTH